MPARGQRKWLTAVQIKIVRDAIAIGLTQDQAAFLAGVSRRRLAMRLEDQLRDLRVGRGRGPKRRGDCDPTEAQIEKMKLAIRASRGHLPAGQTSPEPPAP